MSLDQAMVGAWCTSILGDLGAEVIKVESLMGDILRHTAGPNLKGESFHYLAHNRNKKSVVLNLIAPSALEAFYDLVRVSDVVFSNIRVGAMERLKAGYDDLKVINPRVIYCTASTYGNTGPYKTQPGYDVIALGLSGVLSCAGEPGRPPVRPAMPLADFIGALYSATGILAALVKRERTGKGSQVDVSMVDSAMAGMTYLFMYYFLSGEVPGPQGRFHEGLVPYGIFKAKDRYITIGISWPRICRVVGEEWMVDEPRFATAELRVKYKDEINQIIEKALSKAPAEQWIELFKVEDIPAGLVKSIDEVVQDLQVIARNMVLTLKHPYGEYKMVGNPIKMEDIKEEDFQPAPLLGQHTDEVFSNILGYSGEKIKKIKREEEEYAEEAKRRIRKVK